MDYYTEPGPAVDRHAQLQLQAWHIASSPPWRCGFLPRLSSIPEACERPASSTLPEQQQRQCGTSCPTDDTPSGVQHMHAQLYQVQPQLHPVVVHQHTADAMHSSDDEKSESRSSSSSAGAAGWDEEEEAADASDLSAVAASAWATNIRHFTDCVPITAESVCSSSTLVSVPCGLLQRSSSGKEQQSSPRVQHQHRQQQDVYQQHQQRAPAGSSCSLPNSSSSRSLLPSCEDAAGEAAVQASLLAALQELDDLEWCPWDRVAKWLETHTAAAAAAAAAAQGDHQQQLDPADEAAGCSSNHSSSSTLVRSSSQVEQQQQASASADLQEKGGAVFDAPEWWQEAVLARLQQQREAFHGSWWSRARVLASLAAAKAACTLQL